jgi:hypothetical protein
MEMTMSVVEMIVLAAGAVAFGVGGWFAFRGLWVARGMRLMRCPETGSIAFVDAVRVKDGARPIVRSCTLQPERRECGSGCLERFDETAPGYRVKVEALRPFAR